jgi:hypothetical protein
MASQKNQGEPTFWESMTENMPDADVVFAYDTVKEVKVLDRRLGMIYYTVLMMVFFYIVIYVFMIKQQYLDTEKTTGWTLTKVVNPAHDEDGNPWDIMDSVTNPGEQGAVFVPTRVLVTNGRFKKDTASQNSILARHLRTVILEMKTFRRSSAPTVSVCDGNGVQHSTSTRLRQQYIMWMLVGMMFGSRQIYITTSSCLMCRQPMKRSLSSTPRTIRIPFLFTTCF